MTTATLPSGLVTFVMTDIEGSTKMFRRLGDAYPPLLETHNGLLRKEWAAHGGAEVKTVGDAFIVAFESAADAMEAAWSARKRFGGALRQSGIIAAGALYGLEHHRGRLAEDHLNAARFARAVASGGGAHVVEPDTNIVMIDLSAPMTAAQIAREAAGRGVLVSVWTATRLRVVTHLDVTTAQVDEAADIMRQLLVRG